jgi:AraC family transcriptional regulator of adaptative response / DNA-3-methyladenine glycosylase II
VWDGAGVIEDLAGAWRGREDVAARAARLIADGVVAREGVAGLAHRLGRDEEAVRAALVAAAGAGPEALDRSAAVASARALLEGGDLAVSEVADATGFGSAARLGVAVREAFGLAPGALRGRPREPPPGGSVRLRLRCRAPIDLGAVFSFLALRAVPGVEESLDGGGLRRSLRLPHGAGVVELAAAADEGGGVRCALWAADLRDVVPAVARCRRLLDLDADPAAVTERLGGGPLLGPLVRAAPGRRAPGHVDGAELAVRAVLGQQVSLTAARKLAGRLVADHGEPLPVPRGGVTHLFPTPAAVAAADPATLAMPRSRRTALLALGRALAGGDLALDPGADRAAARRALLALPGIGPWTADYVDLRAHGDPDAFPVSDLGVRHALRALGAPAGAREALALAEAWRPWRAYATHHLWASLATGRSSGAPGRLRVGSRTSRRSRS